mmetsp:Transcript_82917/g.164522  ORF Transcript_82917/g.164522 Transcript_82917/m.164522 type:complete len:208 (-) Transcript_82917:338-961(-)
MYGLRKLISASSSERGDESSLVKTRRLSIKRFLTRSSTKSSRVISLNFWTAETATHTCALASTMPNSSKTWVSSANTSPLALAIFTRYGHMCIASAAIPLNFPTVHERLTSTRTGEPPSVVALSVKGLRISSSSSKCGARSMSPMKPGATFSFLSSAAQVLQSVSATMKSLVAWARSSSKYCFCSSAAILAKHPQVLADRSSLSVMG